eukprot:2671629-Prymnesium_polylepis.1
MPPSRRRAVRLPRKQRHRNERRYLRPRLAFTGPSNRYLNLSCGSGPLGTALRKPAVSHGTHTPHGPISPPL